MGEKYTMIMGDSIDDKIKSIDQVLAAQNKKPMKQVIHSRSNSPLTVELFQSNVLYPILLTSVKGSIENLIFYIENTDAKKLSIHTLVQNGSESINIKTDVKTGITKINGSYEVKGDTLVFISYSIEEGATTTVPIVGFTFREDVDVNKIKS